MTSTVLPQLEKIVLDLTTQKTAAESHLAEIQSKLDAIQAIIPLFHESKTADEKSRTSPNSKASGTEKSAVNRSTSTATRSTKKSASGRAKTKAAQKATSKSKKVDGRTATWQKYTRKNVAEQGIPSAVKLILSTQPERNFKIAEVMSSIFEDDMPKTQYLKARNRISNILSGGVRDGDWFKGDRGTYRLAETNS